MNARGIKAAINRRVRESDQRRSAKRVTAADRYAEQKVGQELRALLAETEGPLEGSEE